MKKLFAILLALLLLCGCNTEEPKEPELPAEDLPQIENETEETPGASVSIFEENGKFGLKDSKGNVLAEPVYDSFEETDFYFALITDGGTYMAPFYENGRWILKEQPKRLTEIYLRSGGFVPGGPYETFEVRDWDGGRFGISGARDGNVYTTVFEEGKFSEIESPAQKNDSVKTAYGYTVYSYYYHTYTTWKGLKNEKGEVVIPEVNSRIELPFEDRAVCIEGNMAFQALEEGRCIVYELPSGKELNSEYNYIEYKTFDEGYFGVGIKSWEFWNTEDYYENAGCCFVDKDGKAVSEDYERIYCENNEWNVLGEYLELESKIFAQRFDGTVEEFTVKELLMKE